MTSQTDPIPADAPCQFLEWDSNHFGVNIGRVNGCQLDDPLCGAIERWSSERKIACLYFFCRADDPASSRWAESAGFHLADVRLTFGRDVDPSMAAIAPPPAIRPAEPGDVPALEKIAARSHRDSRFYADPRFSREACDRLYAVWIGQSCREWADAVWVAEHANRPAAYLACHVDPAGATGKIGIVAVDEPARGLGLGGALIQTCLSWLASRQIRKATVVTQGRNLAAQRLYQRHGFVSQAMELVYHKWRLNG